MTDRLAAAPPSRRAPPSGELSWGLDAASFPPAYWHWLHLNSLRRHQEEPTGQPGLGFPPRDRC